MKPKIEQKLREIEKKYEVKILFAVESGSRAWGFHSLDSDYDIRFVYQRKKDDYLNLWERKDTIHFTADDNLDGSGWDIQKALRLLAKSNASFTEWLFSPIIYRADNEVLEELKSIGKRNFNPIASFYHYHSMNKNFKEILKSNDVNLKKFFYNIRTALCGNWIVKNQTIPPVEFKKLYPLIDEKYHSKLDELIAFKNTQNEIANHKIDEELIFLVKKFVEENEVLKENLKATKPSKKEFNDLFLKVLK